MADRNVIQREFDSFGKAAGMLKRSGTWYRTSSEVTQCLNLQKSQYGPKYYINIGFWLHALGETQFPKEHQVHVTARIDNFVADAGDQVTEVLNLDSGIPEAERGQRLRELLTFQLLPLLDKTLSLDGIRQMRRDGFLKFAGIRRPALPILAVE